MVKTAMIVVDVQRDFCAGGALPAWNTPSLLVPLQDCIDLARRSAVTIIFTQDWHPANHNSFQTNGGKWPDHCVENTAGAELMPPLQAAAGDIVVHKGTAVDGEGYSAFDSIGLEARLRELKVGRVSVAGIATEYCVRATALDANRAGLETILLTDLIRPVEETAAPKVLTELGRAGVQLMPSPRWLLLLTK
ncbi:MAG TPA: isochorismatase family protein [Verrucomicrobiae bacterium]|nr:isochorismatase family protein [Verrucomicrobiae bacterium]